MLQIVGGTVATAGLAALAVTPWRRFLVEWVRDRTEDRHAAGATPEERQRLYRLRSWRQRMPPGDRKKHVAEHVLQLLGPNLRQRCLSTYSQDLERLLFNHQQYGGPAPTLLMREQIWMRTGHAAPGGGPQWVLVSAMLHPDNSTGKVLIPEAVARKLGMVDEYGAPLLQYATGDVYSVPSLLAGPVGAGPEVRPILYSIGGVHFGGSMPSDPSGLIVPGDDATAPLVLPAASTIARLQRYHTGLVVLAPEGS